MKLTPIINTEWSVESEEITFDFTSRQLRNQQFGMGNMWCCEW